VRPSRSTIISLALFTGAVLGAPATAAASTANCSPPTSPTLARQNASARTLTNRLLRNTSYTPIIRTFTPKFTRTRHFTGYGSIVIRAPRGTDPVVGFLALRGAAPCAIRITSASVVLRRDAYVLNFESKGEQGNPGRITITLVSR
jgi:hypothetical protein